MKYDLPDSVLMEIRRYAIKNDIKKVILFGSRARGTNRERSDVDLAVSGGDAEEFHEDLEEEAWTLLTFDVVKLDGRISDELREEIRRDGVVVYEKI